VAVADQAEAAEDMDACSAPNARADCWNAESVLVPVDGQLIAKTIPFPQWPVWLQKNHNGLDVLVTV
jgi:hypothetical protein